MPTEAERLATLETRADKHDKEITQICADIKEIKEKLLGRPTWFVCVLISCLLTAVGTMAMYIITL